MNQFGKEITNEEASQIEMDFATWRSTLVFVLAAVIFIINIYINIPYTEKIDFDQTEAEGILRDIYGPLEEFTGSLVATSDKTLLILPQTIINEADFVRLFHTNINENVVMDFYEDLVLEKNNKLFINANVYIPSIYCGGGKVTKAYIRKRHYLLAPSNDSETLIIKESWIISGEAHKRTNYFIRKKTGEWVLDSFNGTLSYEFTDIKDNPWRQ